MSETKSTKYVIEVASKGNKRLWFDPVKATLRGRWDVAHVAKFQSSGEFSPLNAIHETVPQIPGVHVWIDLQKGEAGYFDPLESTEQGKKIKEKLNGVLKSFNKYFPVVEPKTMRNLDHDEIKEFLYSMVRAVESGNAAPVTGSPELPSLDAVKKMPGKRIINRGYAMSPETQEIERRWEHEVPVKKPQGANA